eukprot:9150098-Lingulodinium_polyedra.AAC.1
MQSPFARPTASPWQTPQQPQAGGPSLFGAPPQQPVPQLPQAGQPMDLGALLAGQMAFIAQLAAG